MPLSPDEVRHAMEYDLYTLILPYALRTGVVGAIILCLERFVGGNLRGMVLFGSPARPEANNAETDSTERVDVCSSTLLLKHSWTEVQQRLGWTRCQALVVSGVRLVFWHWLQPLMYSLVFYAYSDLMSGFQFTMGFIVLVREMLYFSYTIVGLLVRPSYLLFSPALAECSDRMLYFAMPEKFVLFLLVSSAKPVWYFMISALFGADLCGFLALVVGLANHNMWPALACGYAVTSVSFFPTLISITCAATRAKHCGEPVSFRWHRGELSHGPSPLGTLPSVEGNRSVDPEWGS